MLLCAPCNTERMGAFECAEKDLTPVTVVPFGRSVRSFASLRTTSCLVFTTTHSYCHPERMGAFECAEKDLMPVTVVPFGRSVRSFASLRTTSCLVFTTTH